MGGFLPFPVTCDSWEQPEERVKPWEGVKGWYTRNVMTCILSNSTAKAFIHDRPKASCQQTLAKTITYSNIYNQQLPRGFMLQSLKVASSYIGSLGAFYNEMRLEMLGFG